MVGVWPLTGRDQELDRITRMIEDSPSGHGVVIAGSAGVGKTRLARESLQWSRVHGRSVRWVAATRSAQAVPFGAFIGVTSAFGPDPLNRVGEVLDSLTAGSNGPAVIGIDDSHLLDPLSAEVVRQLVSHRMAHVVCTLRNGEPAPAVITDLWKSGPLERLELQPLSLDEATALLESVLEGQLDSHTVRRLWSLTEGNVLYLRQLIEGELATGRIRSREDVWVWEGDPVMSPGLRDLVGTRIGHVPEPVGEVLDVLAVAEPLDASIVQRLSTAAGVSEAVQRGLVTVGTNGRRQVRFGHPLFGEARRASLRDLRRSRLSGMVAAELTRRGDDDMRDTIRRAVLMLDSDRPAAVELLDLAAHCAMQLLDLTLAERLSRAAFESGGGCPAAVAHAITLTTLGRGTEAYRDLAGLAGQGLSDRDAAEIGALRAAITGWMFARPTKALALLDATAPNAARSGRGAAHRAVGASLHASRGHPAEAVRAATVALATRDLPDPESTFAELALVISLGDLGRIDEMTDVAERAYDHAAHSVRSSQLRFAVGLFQGIALRRVGRLGELETLSARMRSDSVDIPGSLQGVSASCMGLSELAMGRLDSAVRWLKEARTAFTLLHESTGQRVFCLAWLAEALAKTGRAASAEENLHDLAARLPRESAMVDFAVADIASVVARGWSGAADGDTRTAVATVRTAADRAFTCGQPTAELFFLQTATQFGDATVAERLTQLERVLECPRAPIAAAHARALAAGDAAALDEVSCRYDALGDRVAAVDAAAQSATAYTRADRRGAALISRERAQRWARACRRADTPSLRATAEPALLTGRQREVARLAAGGLSNQQIADRLGVSVRTVEGHLYRACQRAGVGDRRDLIRLLSGLR